MASATDFSARPTPSSAFTSVVRSKSPGYSKVIAKPSSSNIFGSDEPHATGITMAQASSGSSSHLDVTYSPSRQ